MWNGSATEYGTSHPSETRPRKTSVGLLFKTYVSCVVASMFAVVCVSIVAWLIVRSHPNRPDFAGDNVQVTQRKIAEITPHIPADQRTLSSNAVLRPRHQQIDENNSRQLLTNIEQNVPGRRTPRPVKVIKPAGEKTTKQPIFQTLSDNHLEQLVNYQPGERFLAVVSPAEISRDFMLHLDDKIEILPDDLPSVVERKRNYAQIREGIKKALNNGANLEEMIIDARRTLDKIANMRDEYLRALDDAENDGATDDELDDLATAATMLLQEHGANPILSPRQHDDFWEKKSRQEEE